MIFERVVRIVPFVSGPVLFALVTSNASAHDEGIFDAVEVKALELALKVPNWKSTVTPPVSEAFENLLKLHPTRLAASDDGKTWTVRIQGKKKTLDAAKFPFSKNDLLAAQKLLEIPYIAAYVDCLEDAFRGEASTACLEELSKKIKKFSDAHARLYLQADLGARIQSLSLQNPQWARLFNGQEDAAPYLKELMASYEAVEKDKVVAASQYHSGMQEIQPGPIAIAFAPTEGSAWLPVNTPGFETANVFSDEEKQKPFQHRLLGWRFDASGKPDIISNEKNLFGEAQGIYTYTLTPDQHFLLKGGLDAQKYDELRKAGDIQQFLHKAADYHLDVFSSQPGSTSLGVVSPPAPGETPQVSPPP